MFATVKDLETILRRTFSDADLASVEALLEVATDEVRGTIGQHIAPTTTSTFRDRPDAEGVIDLPQHPVVKVVGVTDAHGDDVDFEWIDGHVKVRRSGEVYVTFTYGYAEVPPALKQMTIALAASALRHIELGIGPSASGISSLSIDDFRVAFADGGDKSGMVIPEIQAESLRERFGKPGVVVVGMR